MSHYAAIEFTLLLIITLKTCFIHITTVLQLNANANIKYKSDVDFIVNYKAQIYLTYLFDYFTICKLVEK